MGPLETTSRFHMGWEKLTPWPISWDALHRRCATSRSTTACVTPGRWAVKHSKTKACPWGRKIQGRFHLVQERVFKTLSFGGGRFHALPSSELRKLRVGGPLVCRRRQGQGCRGRRHRRQRQLGQGANGFLESEAPTIVGLLFPNGSSMVSWCSFGQAPPNVGNETFPFLAPVRL